MSLASIRPQELRIAGQPMVLLTAAEFELLLDRLDAAEARRILKNPRTKWTPLRNVERRIAAHHTRRSKSRLANARRPS